jgi:hypothetical protein
VTLIACTLEFGVLSAWERCVRTDPSKTLQRAPLRVGVLIRGGSVSRWVAHLLDGIDACSFAELAGFVLDAEPRPRRRAVRRVWAGRSRLLYELYCRLDVRRFGKALNPFEEIDQSDRLGRLPDYNIDAEPIARIKGWDLDVMLIFGSGVIPGALLGCARYGVWSHHHDDRGSCLGGPPLFWEIYDGARVSGSVLLRRTEEGTGDVIYRSFSAPDPISLHRTRTRIYWKSAEFALRKLRDLHRDGEKGVVQQGDPPRPKASHHDAPTNRQMLRFGWRVAARLVRQKTRKALRRQQWFLAYRRREAGLPAAERFRTATLLVPPRDRFYADPCLVDWEGSTYLFFEDFRFAEGKGVVSCCQLTPDGPWTRPQIVLERPYHLSYPFVFFVGEDAFMLPETAANGAIELYKARSFPGDWALEAVLVSDVRAVDPTLIVRDGRYWLFANVAAVGASTNDELFLFSARSLRGPWASHPRNPIVSDVRRARPAGRPFIDASGGLIRPSQDCSGFYGSAVVFSRIEALSETDYRETQVGRLEPSWQRSNLGTHTYTCSETWEAIDGRAWVPKFAERNLRYATSKHRDRDVSVPRS